MRGCDRTVTLYHRTYDPASRSDIWSRTVYPAASWYGAQAATVSDNGLLTADAYTVRIATSDEITAAPGDVLVLGEVTDTVTGSAVLTGKYHGRCFVRLRMRAHRSPGRRDFSSDGVKSFSNDGYSETRVTASESRAALRSLLADYLTVPVNLLVFAGHAFV